MSDDPAFLRTILERPEDDASRLVYADRLDEQAGRRGEDVPCPRAEFIRVQCELARWKDGDLTRESIDRHAALRRRERDLLALRTGVTALWSTWGLPPSPDGYYLADFGETQNQHGVGVRFRRGFVAAVRCEAATFVGGQCGQCVGTGNGSDPDINLDCPACRGTGTTPGIAAALFAAQPVTAVRLTDLRPEHVDRDPGFDCWQWGNDAPTFAPGGWFPTSKTAIEAMERSAVNWGRSVAAGHTHRVSCPMCGDQDWYCDGNGICQGAGEVERPGLPPLTPAPA